MNCQIVQKKQRLSPLHKHIVDVHRHQINPHGIELFYFAGELNFAAHPIRTGHENSAFIIFLEESFIIIEPKHSCKAAFKVNNSWPKCTGNAGMDFSNHLLIGIDTYTRFFVADVFTHSFGTNRQTYAFDNVPKRTYSPQRLPVFCICRSSRLCSSSLPAD